MNKIYPLLIAVTLIIPSAFAFNPGDCEQGLGPLSSYLVNDFTIANPGYKIVKANVPPSYSWGGALNIINNNRAITSLYCIDADQFFTIEKQGDPKQQCTLYSDTEFGTSYIEEYDTKNATLKCTIAPILVSTPHNSKYSILYSGYQITVRPIKTK